jgi:hypothetical protein
MANKDSHPSQDMLFFQEASREPIGTCLPSLGPNKMFNNIKHRIKHPVKNEIKNNITLYSHPLPLARDIILPQKALSKRPLLINLLKIKREITLRNHIGFDIFQHTHEHHKNQKLPELVRSPLKHIIRNPRLSPIRDLEAEERSKTRSPLLNTALQGTSPFQL